MCVQQPAGVVLPGGAGRSAWQVLWKDAGDTLGARGWGRPLQAEPPTPTHCHPSVRFQKHISPRDPKCGRAKQVLQAHGHRLIKQVHTLLFPLHDLPAARRSRGE